MKSIAVQLDDDQYQELQILADLEKRSIDELIHQAVVSLVVDDSSVGDSLSTVAAHESGALRELGSRSDILDEMLDR